MSRMRSNADWEKMLREEPMKEVRMPVKAMYAWIKKTRNMLGIQVLSSACCSQWGMGLVGA